MNVSGAGRIFSGNLRWKRPLLSSGAHYVIERLHLSHIWTHPGLQGQFRVDSSQELRLHAVYTACQMEGTLASGLDGFCALPPQHVHDLLAVCAISRVWKSRSDLLCHPYVTTHAIARIDVLCCACLSPCMLCVLRYSFY